MPMTYDPVLNPDQIGKMIGRPTEQVTKMLREKILPGFKRSARMWGILLSDLEAWIKAHCRKAEGAK